MNFFFFQNCISPHQIPFIEELSVFTDVDRVVVIAPRVDYDDRKLMGWKASNLLKVSNVEFIIASSVDQVKKLYESCKGEDTYCFFSGINAFAEVVSWMKLSLNYPFKRGVITEPPLLYHYPLWQHSLRFALKDWKYVKHFNYLLVMGDEFVNYYRFWSKRWKVLPFIYCTEWKERTLPVPITEKLKVLYVGSLSDRKNVVAMFSILSQKSELELGLVGDGEKRTLIETMNKEAKAKVILYGMQPMNRISEIMQQYDVLVLPSKHDGWGAVVNEALTMGLYVVTSNHCGASYLLKDRQQGIVFNLESSSSLNNVIDTCIANRDWIRKTVNERIAWSKDHISCKAVAHYFMQNL